MNLEYVKYKAEHSNKVGRPTDVERSPPAKIIKICEKCISEIAPGKEHNCLKSTKRENLITLMRSTSIGTKSNVLADGLKIIAEEQGQTKRGGEIELQSGSKVLPVKIGTQRSRPKEAKFSHESLKMLGARLNLSDNEIM